MYISKKENFILLLEYPIRVVCLNRLKVFQKKKKKKKVTWIAVTNVDSECALRKKGLVLLGAVGVSVGCGIC